jgi:hypothetical protein
MSKIYPHQQEFIQSVAAVLSGSTFGAAALRAPTDAGKTTALAMSAAWLADERGETIHAVSTSLCAAMAFARCVKIACRRRNAERVPTVNAVSSECAAAYNMSARDTLFIDDADCMPSYELLPLLQRCHHVFLTHTEPLPDSVMFQLTTRYTWLKQIRGDVVHEVDPGSGVLPQAAVGGRRRRTPDIF